MVCVPFSCRPVYVSTVRPQSKHIVVIVDHGASVTETQLQIAKDAAQVILSSIDEHDKVSFLPAMSMVLLVSTLLDVFSQSSVFNLWSMDSWGSVVCFSWVMRNQTHFWKPVLLWGKHLVIQRLKKLKPTDLRQNLVSE